MPVIHSVRFALLCACAFAACIGSRTALKRPPVRDASAPGKDATPTARDSAHGLVADGGPDLTLDMGRDLPVELPADLRADLAEDLPPDLPCASDACRPVTPPNCQPSSETCNGVDDDCDGVVDNGISPVPCPGGGSRYCVAGRMSDCPTRCAVCVPGGQRVCFISYCSYWGLQTCASDGQSWSYCVEQRPVPSACSSVASNKKHARETEQCCIDNGFCCLDEFDLNGNGDSTEMLGRCEDVLCAQ